LDTKKRRARRQPACYDRRVITDRAAYARLCEQERWAALRAMTPEESIAVLEALLSSEIEDISVFADDDHPVSLARALRIPPDRLPRSA
jgi:hypothetical protein